ncbi:MAG: eCIS core domain-containing protein [Stenotrophobium sp.]
MSARITAIILTLMSTVAAAACPEGYSEACVGDNCYCVPDAATIQRALPPPLQDAAEQVAGAALKNLILASRNDAIREGVQPMPPAIRKDLLGFYPAELLDHVRYRVGGGNDLSLQSNALRYGDAAAVTLDDVVVFANQADAQGNSVLWAHEMKHVQQVSEWGLAGFAERYARDYKAVEGPAYAAQDQFAKWRAARNQAQH